MGSEGQQLFDEGWPEGERTVYVSRHGRTTANEHGIHQHWGAYRLSATGRRQAEAARRWWRSRPVDLVVSSPVARALETAEILWGRVDELDSAWTERACPDFEGMSWTEAHEQYPGLFRPDGWLHTDPSTGCHVEGVDVVAARVRAALRRAASRVPSGGVVAVMTHGALLLSVAAPSGSPTRDVANLAVAEVAVDPGRGWWEVRAVHHPVGPSPAAGVGEGVGTVEGGEPAEACAPMDNPTVA